MFISDISMKKYYLKYANVLVCPVIVVLINIDKIPVFEITSVTDMAVYGSIWQYMAVHDPILLRSSFETAEEMTCYQSVITQVYQTNRSPAHVS